MTNGVNGGYRSIFGLDFKNKKSTAKTTGNKINTDINLEFVSKIEALKKQQAQVSDAKSQAMLGNKTYTSEQSQKAQEQIDANREKQTQAIAYTTAAYGVLNEALGKIEAANSAVTSAQNGVKSAQTLLHNLQNAEEPDEERIQEAKSALEEAQNELTNAQDELSAAQNEVDQANAAVEEAQEKQAEIANEIEQMAFAEDDETAEASSEEVLNDFTNQIGQYSETLTELSDKIASLQEQLSQQQTEANKNLEGYDSENKKDDAKSQSPLTINDDGTVTRTNSDGTITVTETKMVDGELVTNETIKQADETTDDKECKKDPIVFKFPNGNAPNGYECYVLMDSTNDKRESGIQFDSSTNGYDSVSDFFGSDSEELKQFEDNGNISIRDLYDAGIRLVLSNEDGRPIDFDGQELSENDEVRVANYDVWENIINYSLKYENENKDDIKLYNSYNEEVDNGILVESHLIDANNIGTYGLENFNEPTSNDKDATTTENVSTASQKDVQYGYDKYNENRNDGETYVTYNKNNGRYEFNTHSGRGSYVCNIIEGLYGVNYASKEGEAILGKLKDLNEKSKDNPYATGVDFYYDKHEGGDIYGAWGMVYADGKFELPTRTELSEALQGAHIDDSKIEEILAGIPDNTDKTENDKTGNLDSVDIQLSDNAQKYLEIISGNTGALETTYKQTIINIPNSNYLSNEEKIYLLSKVSDVANSEDDPNKQNAIDSLYSLKTNNLSDIKSIYANYLSEATNFENIKIYMNKYQSVSGFKFNFNNIDNTKMEEIIQNLVKSDNNPSSGDLYDHLIEALGVLPNNMSKRQLAISTLNNGNLSTMQKLEMISKFKEEENLFGEKDIETIFNDVNIDNLFESTIQDCTNNLVENSAVLRQNQLLNMLNLYSNITGDSLNEYLADKTDKDKQKLANSVITLLSNPNISDDLRNKLITMFVSNPQADGNPTAEAFAGLVQEGNSGDDETKQITSLFEDFSYDLETLDEVRTGRFSEIIGSENRGTVGALRKAFIYISKNSSSMSKKAQQALLAYACNGKNPGKIFRNGNCKKEATYRDSEYFNENQQIAYLPLLIKICF